MICYEAFAKLRLAQFFPPGAEIARLEGWEFMGRVWVGEAIGFTEFLRLRDDPEITRSVALDLADLKPATAAVILSEMEIPVSKGMSMPMARSSLQCVPIADKRFRDDRHTFDFEIGRAEKFDISCTFLDDGGLVYVVVMRHDYMMTSRVV
jgi:hypothetical protein